MNIKSMIFRIFMVKAVVFCSGGSCIEVTGRSLHPTKYSEIKILGTALELVFKYIINENMGKSVHILMFL